METMHAAGRRTLPPVPHAGRGRYGNADTPTERLSPEPISAERHRRRPGAPRTTPAVAASVTATATATATATSEPESDAAQQFVARLRSAAADFAAAAGAESAVVRETVPPARHRRARCRMVLRYADETEADVTFLGAAGEPGSPSRHGFDRQIRRWLGDGQHRDDAWVVADPDAPEGLAIDVSAWVAAS